MSLFDEAVALTARQFRRDDMTLTEYINAYEKRYGVKLGHTAARINLDRLVKDHGYATEERFDTKTSRWCRVWFRP